MANVGYMFGTVMLEASQFCTDIISILSFYFKQSSSQPLLLLENRKKKKKKVKCYLGIWVLNFTTVLNMLLHIYDIIRNIARPISLTTHHFINNKSKKDNAFVWKILDSRKKLRNGSIS